MSPDEWKSEAFRIADELEKARFQAAWAARANFLIGLAFGIFIGGIML